MNMSNHHDTRAKVLIAKTSLDGHWRGVSLVARALRDAGFEVILGGMLRPSQIAQVARDEDVDLVGLNVGGRIEVVYRIMDELREVGLIDTPVFCGGTVPPRAAAKLREMGVEVYPPGTTLATIVEAACALTAEH
jgi:methylmalonyl-CoA mutase C-terminal domain/subunit